MTLPFISYGGSSIISSSLIIGFILTLIKNAKINNKKIFLLLGVPAGICSQGAIAQRDKTKEIFLRY